MKFFTGTSARKKWAAMALIFVALLAWAKTFGPFYVSSAGPDYVNTTFDMDKNASWEAAYVLSTIYLVQPKSLWDQIKDAIIGNQDVIRVVYADGQIADFVKVDTTTAGMRLKQKVGTPNNQDPTSSEENDARCNRVLNGPGGQSYIMVPTGYYGTISVEDDGNGNVVVTGGWISTGSWQMTVPPVRPPNCP